MTKEFVSEIQGKTMEARKGIEPPCKDLQSSTSPLCHRALVGCVLHTAFMGRTQALAENKNPKHKNGPAENHGAILIQHLWGLELATNVT